MKILVRSITNATRTHVDTEVSLNVCSKKHMKRVNKEDPVQAKKISVGR